MMVDAKKILDRVRPGETKERITISIDKEVLESFKKFISDRPISPVVEELMREFNEAAAPGDGSAGARRDITAALAALDDDQARQALRYITGLTAGATDLLQRGGKNPKKPQGNR